LVHDRAREERHRDTVDADQTQNEMIEARVLHNLDALPPREVVAMQRELSVPPRPLDEYPLAIGVIRGDCPRRKVNHPHKVFVLTSRLHISATGRAACLTLGRHVEASCAN